MDFRVKCAMQHVFSVVPGGDQLNYLMKRYVSKTLPIPDRHLERSRSFVRRHIESFRNSTGKNPQTVFEFGSGWDLNLPILFGVSGCRVIASDIKPVASMPLVQNILQRVGASSLGDAGVRYVAPLDARSTGFNDGAFDLITSTSVFEHIPSGHIPAIAKECARILADDGRCSFSIDYQDHWSYFDKRIGWNNFLRHNAATWRLYNPALQFQNRLRHADYIRIFSEHFHVEAVVETGEKPAFPVAEEFRGRDDLHIRGAWFLLSKLSH
jgi:SAM-dependent methyltransferase